MPRYDIPGRASDAGPESRDLEAVDYIDLASEALELARRAVTREGLMDWLSQAEGYIQDAQRVLAKEGK